MAKSPSGFADIFSLLLDESTGRRPGVKGRLELSNLGSRTAGKTFQEISVAVKAAMRNRRLGITNGGYLGLFPRQSKEEYAVCVLDCCHVPFVVRTAGQASRFRLVGECYVHGITDGEAVAGEGVRIGDIILV
ncbi:Heterokaryon incompatibility protein 6, OR allele [Madurella mycetomatis]|uniref:Heterokaryon incompatibility protein 6, OR allele n=1 Tax=Madurella mycetomatis TaxID=100816 RepID=A0A175VYN7_9PEZI|nr:Heterokaryon incompatibility protein 6, OR allele [Madurella mycetomatis]KXX83239.1 Heterokaryon incompatibility protein 6, OR allele [Madurella mycetomatis]